MSANELQALVGLLNRAASEGMLEVGLYSDCEGERETVGTTSGILIDDLSGDRFPRVGLFADRGELLAMV